MEGWFLHSSLVALNIFENFRAGRLKRGFEVVHEYLLQLFVTFIFKLSLHLEVK